MDDLIAINDQARAQRVKKWLVAGLMLYFMLLIGYAISIPQRTVPFFTRIVGFNEYVAGGNLTMRFFVIGTKEQAPLADFHIKMELMRPVTGASFNVFEGSAARQGYVEASVPLPAMQPGDYIARVTATHEKYGQEVSEFRLAILPRAPARSLDVQVLDEVYTKLAPPVKVDQLTPPVELRLIANNGRFTPNLNNTLMLIAERSDNRLPVEGLNVEVVAGKRSIAKLKTDEMGLASFPFYPHSMGDQHITLKMTDPKGNVIEKRTEMRPIGSQVVATPNKQLLPVGEPITFKLETLRGGGWHVDLFDHGNLLLSTVQQMKGAAVQMSLPVPENATGMLYVQVAADFNNPTTSYDSFYVYVYDPKLAQLDEDDPRLKNAQLDDPKLDDILLEKPFKKFWAYVNGSHVFKREITERWLEKINNLSLAKLPYKPRELARQVLAEVPKDYYLLPELLNTRDVRIRDFDKKQRNDRDNVIWLLALSGVVVILLLGMKIFREIRLRDEEGLEYGHGNIVTLLLLLAVVVAGYGMIIYLLTILDWWKGM